MTPLLTSFFSLRPDVLCEQSKSVLYPLRHSAYLDRFLLHNPDVKATPTCHCVGFFLTSLFCQCAIHHMIMASSAERLHVACRVRSLFVGVGRTCLAGIFPFSYQCHYLFLPVYSVLIRSTKSEGLCVGALLYIFTGPLKFSRPSNVYQAERDSLSNLAHPFPSLYSYTKSAKFGLNFDPTRL